MADSREDRSSESDAPIDVPSNSSSNADSDSEFRVNTMKWLIERQSTMSDGGKWSGMASYDRQVRKGKKTSTSPEVLEDPRLSSTSNEEITPDPSNVEDSGVAALPVNVVGVGRGRGRGMKLPSQANPHLLPSQNESPSPQPGSSGYPTASSSSSGPKGRHYMDRRESSVAPTKSPVFETTTYPNTSKKSGRRQKKPTKVQQTVTYYTREEYDRKQEQVREHKRQQREEEQLREERRAREEGNVVEQAPDPEEVDRDGGNAKVVE